MVRAPNANIFISTFYRGQRCAWLAFAFIYLFLNSSIQTSKSHKHAIDFSTANDQQTDSSQVLTLKGSSCESWRPLDLHPPSVTATCIIFSLHLQKCSITFVFWPPRTRVHSSTCYECKWKGQCDTHTPYLDTKARGFAISSFLEGAAIICKLNK